MFASLLSRFLLFFYPLIILSTLLQTSASPVPDTPIAVRDSGNRIRITKPFTIESINPGPNIAGIQSAGTPSLTGPPRDQKIINHGG